MWVTSDENQREAPFASLASDVSAARKDCAFFHAEHLGFDVAIEPRVGFELAALGGDGAFDFAKEFNFAGFHIAYDLGIFTNGDFAFI